jgi:hypothetical protein
MPDNLWIIEAVPNNFGCKQVSISARVAIENNRAATTAEIIEPAFTAGQARGHPGIGIDLSGRTSVG